MAEEKTSKGAVLPPEAITALTQALERSNEIIAQMGTALERANANQAEQAKAIADLQVLMAARPAAPATPKGQNIVVPRVPYKGYVRAREACYIGSLRAAGDVFVVEVPGLWTDDPFEPVDLKGYDRDNRPICDPHPTAKQQPFHLRPRTSEALAALNSTPRKASDWENTDKSLQLPEPEVAPAAPPVSADT